MYYTYVLRSLKDGKLYTGATFNLRERFKSHNDNKVSSTKSRGPFELFYYEACQNKKDAFMREIYLKTGMGKRYLKNRLKRSLSLTGRDNKGFTLIELLVVIAIFSIVATFGLFLSMDFYRTYNSNIAITKIVSVLSKARAQSLANINQKEHGVHVQDNKYIVFARTAPAVFGSQISEDLEIPAGSGTSVTATDIIFERLTGKARNSISACPCYVEIESQGVTKTITVNSEGGIDW